MIDYQFIIQMSYLAVAGASWGVAWISAIAYWRIRDRTLLRME